MPDWMWIPIVLGAAAAQTVRNAAQRGLTASAGTLPATFVRFFYGLPFAVVAYVVLAWVLGGALPHLGRAFLAWVALGSLAQLAATAFLLSAMKQRSFIVAVAYSKTELVQIAIYSVILLGDPLALATVVAILLASVGIFLLSVVPASARSEGASAWLSPAALLGLGSGAAFAIAAVAYRGATLVLGPVSPALAGAYALAWGQGIQTIVLGAYLLARERAGLRQVIVQWRTSSVAGVMGSLASLGWFTAF